MLDHLCTPHPWMYLAFLAAPMVARRRSGLIARRAQRRGIWFGVAPTRAYVTSVERVLDLHTGARRFKEDGELMERLALPFFRRSGCPSSFLRAHRAVALFSNSDANVYLCCASFGRRRQPRRQFFDDAAELQSVNGNHPLCGPCMKHSVMTYFDRASDGDAEFSKLAVAPRPGPS